MYELNLDAWATFSLFFSRLHTWTWMVKILLLLLKVTSSIPQQESAILPKVLHRRGHLLSITVSKFSFCIKNFSVYNFLFVFFYTVFSDTSLSTTWTLLIMILNISGDRGYTTFYWLLHSLTLELGKMRMFIIIKINSVRVDVVHAQRCKDSITWPA